MAVATKLQERRLSLGWSQGELVSALGRQAEVNGVRIAKAASLKTLISRWENGHVLPDPPHRLLLCLLYTSPSPRDQRGSRMPSSA